MTKTNYPVFSYKLAKKLTDSGYVIAGLSRNKADSGKIVFYFADVDGLHDFIVNYKAN